MWELSDRARTGTSNTAVVLFNKNVIIVSAVLHNYSFLPNPSACSNCGRAGNTEEAGDLATEVSLGQAAQSSCVFSRTQPEAISNL